MSNDKKITAEEFLKKLDDASGATWTDSDIDICKAFIEFAKLHVAAALKIASELEETNGTQGYKIYPESILNAYPLDNIK